MAVDVMNMRGESIWFDQRRCESSEAAYRANLADKYVELKVEVLTIIKYRQGLMITHATPIVLVLQCESKFLTKTRKSGRDDSYRTSCMPSLHNSPWYRLHTEGNVPQACGE